MNGKIAITAMGMDEGAVFSRHFATATHFLVYDTATGVLDARENQARALTTGRGVKAAEILVDSGVNALVTDLIGPKPFELLNKKGVKIYQGPRIGIKDVLQAIREDRLGPPLSAPTEEAHARQHGD
ncbi:MAG: NifB/NifX family molybdenum-iron cluster-binding protein [Dissulfurimicrobium hydrothermale]|uniref:NifB/NifX family molybdenum-iron cluster-binding protein n=1 Tax=Dissulfurimicrobium hydrothermale TaxID=1750598 RepID=UPI003C777E50